MICLRHWVSTRLTLSLSSKRCLGNLGRKILTVLYLSGPMSFTPAGLGASGWWCWKTHVLYQIRFETWHYCFIYRTTMTSQYKPLRAQFLYLEVTILIAGGRSERMDRKRPTCPQHVVWIISVKDLAWCETKGSWLVGITSVLFRTLNSLPFVVTLSSLLSMQTFPG